VVKSSSTIGRQKDSEETQTDQEIQDVRGEVVANKTTIQEDWKGQGGIIHNDDEEKTVICFREAFQNVNSKH
jgi:hypothetical protein